MRWPFGAAAGPGGRRRGRCARARRLAARGSRGSFRELAVKPADLDVVLLVGAVVVIAAIGVARCGCGSWR